MKKTTFFHLLIFAGIVVSLRAAERHVFILSGQSNMARMKEKNGFLPEAEKLLAGAEVEYIKVAAPGKPIRNWLAEWDAMATDAGLDPIAIRKGDRKKGSPYYDAILEQIRLLLKRPVASVSFIWMQGESDARGGAEKIYGNALQTLIAKLRRDLKAPKMKIVIGRISDYGARHGKGKSWPGWQNVRDAQQRVAANDPLAQMIDTDDCNGPKHALHHPAEGYELMGRRMARAAFALIRAEGFLQNGVTAHRGNSGEFPECTMPAFASGIAVGADWLELDILRTKDGKLVVIHDRTTGRIGDRNLEVMESTYEELSRVDVATDFRKRHGKSLAECPAERIPLLAEVLKLVMKQRKTRVSIQPKMDCVAEAIELIKQTGAQRWVGFNDGNLRYMSDVKRLAPEISVFWDRGNSDLSKDLMIAREHGFEALVLNSGVLTLEKVRRIQQAGFEAGVWTVNNESELRRFVEMGVDRIYTDHPVRLLELKHRRQTAP